VIRKGSLAVLIVLGASMTLFGLSDAWGSQPPGHKVTLCHRTDSNTNPYVQITVDVAAGGLKGGHEDHTGPIWNPTLKASHVKWGDIIPAFTYGSQIYPGMNVAAANPSVPDGDRWLANGCKDPGPLVAPPGLPPGLRPGTPTAPLTSPLNSTTPASASAAISGASTVHTGEPWAGSMPWALAVVGAGLGLLSLGRIKRRGARARHVGRA
jgi:hypothetical protein